MKKLLIIISLGSFATLSLGSCTGYKYNGGGKPFDLYSVNERHTEIIIAKEELPKVEVVISELTH